MPQKLVETLPISTYKILEFHTPLAANHVSESLGIIPDPYIESIGGIGDYYQNIGYCLLIGALAHAGVEPAKIEEHVLDESSVFERSDNSTGIWPSTATNDLFVEHNVQTHTTPEKMNGDSSTYSVATLAAGIIALGQTVEQFLQAQSCDIAPPNQGAREYTYHHSFAPDQEATWQQVPLSSTTITIRSREWPDEGPERIDPAIYFTSTTRTSSARVIALEARRVDTGVLPGMKSTDELAFHIQAPGYYVSFGYPGGVSVNMTDSPFLLHKIDEMDAVLSQANAGTSEE